MTRLQFFANVAEGNITEEVKAYAADQATKLGTPTPQQIENAALKEDIVAFLKEKTEPVISAEIAKHFEISTSKATGLCGVMVKDGILVKSKVNTDNGERVGYSIA